MKIESLKIKNFKGFEHLELSFNDTVTRFVGLNGSGKTSIFEAIWAGFKGIAENDKGGNIIGDRYQFIGKSSPTAKIEIICIGDGRKVSVTTVISKSGNAMEFRDESGIPIDGTWVKDLLNVALMNASQFIKLSPREQAVKLGINLSEFKSRLAAKKAEFTTINAELRAINGTPVPEVKRVDIPALYAQKKEISDKLNQKYLQNKADNEALRKKHKEDQEAADLLVEEFNAEQTKRDENITKAVEAVTILTNLGFKSDQLTKFVDSLPTPEEFKTFTILKEPEYVTELPDDSELKAIDEKIQLASGTNEQAAKYELYTQNLEKYKETQKRLEQNKKEQQDIEAEQVTYMQKFNFGFEGLTVDDEGGLLLNGRVLNTYSKGEQEIIVARLATSQNPKFKVRMIDEFQSLDEFNQERLINELLDLGYQLLIVEVGKEKKTADSVLLRECKIVDSIPEQKKLL